ncbi:aminoacyl-tRNA hydrolase [Sutterella sp.]|uniref:aminoacyl-tRNA hydrolase n=1 Tax=Sutterella sp. TaxID=1981025 RepID=UPI0026DF2419|nr:aminoacyl-tRNA hydrolase [Sutterella sp.]MDO5530718.1 aminoacyl-tRNA hydrolase [Sutterella sp.]
MAQLTPIRLIAGLGNPGSEYVRTRHNAGFRFVDALAAKTGGRFREEGKFKGEICRVRLAGEEVWLVKPLTFMNCSGECVAAVAGYYKIKPEEVLVVHDEMDLLPGCMRLKLGGGNAGHNGLKSVSAQFGTPNFWRLRLGIGHPRTLGLAQQVFDFVLSSPNAEQDAGLTECIEAALPTAALWAEGDMTKAQRAIAGYSAPKKPEAKDGKAADKPAAKLG